MKLALKVTYLDDSTDEVVARFGDFVAFEQAWNRSVANFQAELRLTDLGWMAWQVLTRQKETAKRFPEWVQGVANVEASDTEEGVSDSPLEPTPPLG